MKEISNVQIYGYVAGVKLLGKCSVSRHSTLNARFYICRV